jgi:hypothetical protein
LSNPVGEGMSHLTSDHFWSIGEGRSEPLARSKMLWSARHERPSGQLPILRKNFGYGEQRSNRDPVGLRKPQAAGRAAQRTLGRSVEYRFQPRRQNPGHAKLGSIPDSMGRQNRCGIYDGGRLPDPQQQPDRGRMAPLYGRVALPKGVPFAIQAGRSRLAV